MTQKHVPTWNDTPCMASRPDESDVASNATWHDRSTGSSTPKTHPSKPLDKNIRIFCLEPGGANASLAEGMIITSFQPY